MSCPTDSSPDTYEAFLALACLHHVVNVIFLQEYITMLPAGEQQPKLGFDTLLHPCEELCGQSPAPPRRRAFQASTACRC